MRVLFPSDSIDRSQPDEAFAREVELARASGASVGIVNTDLLGSADEAERAVRRIPPTAASESAIYRGWMLSAAAYERLHAALAARGTMLVTSPGAYRFCHHLPASYAAIAEHTPRSVWTASTTRPARAELALLLAPFGNRPLVLKDYVKSEKHAWEEACYIPCADDLDAVERVLDSFIALRGDSLEGGFVFREFVELRPAGRHPKSAMPLAREYRLVYWSAAPLAGGHYWRESASGEPPPSEPFDSIAARIPSPFFTMDVAERADGEWIVIELGDGQVAEIREDQGLDGLYERLTREPATDDPR